MKKFLKIVLNIYFNSSWYSRWFFSLYDTYKRTTSDVLDVKVENNKERVLQPGNEFKVTTFNIGYAGLDKDQDFFMDGGKGSGSSSKEQTEAELEKYAFIFTK